MLLEMLLALAALVLPLVLAWFLCSGRVEGLARRLRQRQRGERSRIDPP
jgi:hypothetical protein